MNRTLRAFVALLSCLSPIARADSEWAAPVSGSYGVMAFWLPQDVPNTPEEIATIGWGPSPFSVTLDASSPPFTTIGGLLVTNPEVTLNVVAGRVLTIESGPFLNAGTIVLNSDGLAGVASLALSSSTGLQSGVIRLSQASSLLKMMPGAVLTNHARIEGRGNIEGDIVNRGQVESNLNSYLELADGNWSNESLIRATAGCRISLKDLTILNNNGSIEADGGNIKVGGSTTARIVGGSISTSNGGLVEIESRDGVTFDNVSFDGLMHIASGGMLVLEGHTVNDGLIFINPPYASSYADLVVSDGGIITGTGQIQLRGSVVSRLINLGRATIGESQRVFGLGTLEGDWDLLGTLSPGNPSIDIFPFGTILCEGSLDLHPTSLLELEIASVASGGHDKIQSTSLVNLNGTLTVQLIGTYAPRLGDSVTIVEAAGVTGRFMHLVAPTMPHGLALRLTYGATSARIRVVCTADFNIDDRIDVFDLLEFLNQFSRGEAGADLNSDADLNFFDVQVFLSAYSDGCP